MRLAWKRQGGEESVAQKPPVNRLNNFRKRHLASSRVQKVNGLSPSHFLPLASRDAAGQASCPFATPSINLNAADQGQRRREGADSCNFPKLVSFIHSDMTFFGFDQLPGRSTLKCSYSGSTRRYVGEKRFCSSSYRR